MAQQTLKPPSATLYLATGLAGGFTIAAWATVFLGIVMFRSIPPERQATYLILGLLAAATTKILGIRLIIGRERYARHVAAQWEAAKVRQQVRQQQEDEEQEWARWWAEARDQDTIAFGTTVVSLEAHRVTHQPKVAG
ncbi:hypothetical protein AB0N38_26075 [Micromonospora aurantiaca]|uniref:hypothetical protein n=1 Tax=Micromonospora aurantiaca (nom. illeg.) TaxID=47850 RepID=UPI0034223C56